MLKENIRHIVFCILNITLIEERIEMYVGCTKFHTKVIGTKCSCLEAPTALQFKIYLIISNNNENDYVNNICFDTIMKQHFV